MNQNAIVTADLSIQSNDENDEFVTYKKLLNKRLEKSDLLINQLLLENEILQKKLDTLGVQHTTLREEYTKNCEKLVLMDGKLQEQEDNDIILNDFLEHYLNLRVHSTSAGRTTLTGGNVLNGSDTESNQSDNRQSDNRQSENRQSEIIIDISQSNPDKTIVLDYKLIIKNEDEKSTDNESAESQNQELQNQKPKLTRNKNTIVVFVPLLSHRDVQELMVLKEKLPEYLLTTIKFPLDYLPKLYGKLQKSLNKS